MHRFRTRRSLFRLRISSLTFLVFFISCTLALPAMVWGFVIADPRGQSLSLILAPCALVTGLLYLILSAGLRCPLCHGPLLTNPGCSRNSKGSRVLGSHRLGVATGVLLLGRFRCQCCGEPCSCQLRSR